MKIAYIVLKSLPYSGGIEKYTEEIGSRLAGRGHNIVVYTMKHYQNGQSACHNGITVKSVPAVKSRSLEKMSAAFAATLNVCLEKDIDIIHFHAFGPSVFSVIPRLLGKKIVVQGHGLEWKRAKWGAVGRAFLKMTEYPSIKFAHRIAVVSRVQKKYLKDKYNTESDYIPTGVNPACKRPPSLIKGKYGLVGNDYILFVARLVKEKGAHYLIEAYNNIKTDMKLVIAGDAMYENRYKKELFAAAGGNPNIIFTGFAAGKLLEELYSNPYLYVLPSRIEGLPTTLLEAMSYGNCCLASDIEENIEALNGNGFTFNSGDVGSLCETMRLLLSRPDLAESKKASAREYVLKNFSWDSISAGFERLYNELLAGKNVQDK